jgi:hypothetical protein
MAAEPRATAVRLVAPARGVARTLLVEQVEAAVSGYVLGNVVISVLAGIATWLVLTILGVHYALAFALAFAIVVAFFDLIPLVGATLGAIIVSLGTLTVHFPVATIVWIAFIIVWQRFEDYVVQPVVYRRAVQVNPLVTNRGRPRRRGAPGRARRAAGDTGRRRDPDRPARLVFSAGGGRRCGPGRRASRPSGSGGPA